MEMKDNPLLKPEDYMAGYRDKVEDLKNRPELVELDKLCYELFFINDMGKRFMKIVEERYLIPSLANRNDANYNCNLIWSDGFKDFIRLVIGSAMSHENRIKAEGTK